MTTVGKQIDYSKYCAKCVYCDIPVEKEPCRECTEQFFKNWQERKMINFKRRKRNE